MSQSPGKSLFVFCMWMMGIVLMPFVLATFISLLYSATGSLR